MEKPFFAVMAVLILFLGLFMITTAHAAENPVTEAFYEAADYYDLDPILLMSIATLESGYGTSTLAQNRNNWFGWTRSNGEFMNFDSPEACVWHVARAIANRPHANIVQIAEWYNPHYLGTWSLGVLKIYEKLVV